ERGIDAAHGAASDDGNLRHADLPFRASFAPDAVAGKRAASCSVTTGLRMRTGRIVCGAMTTPLNAPPDRHVSLDEMRALVGREAGVSDWLAIGQDRIDAFADLCGDHQFIHVDPERAARTPMGGTVAH